MTDGETHRRQKLGLKTACFAVFGDISALYPIYDILQTQTRAETAYLSGFWREEG